MKDNWQVAVLSMASDDTGSSALCLRGWLKVHLPLPRTACGSAMHADSRLSHKSGWTKYMAQLNSEGFRLFWPSDADSALPQSSALHLPLRALPIWRSAQASEDVKLKEKSSRRFDIQNKHDVILLECEAPNSAAREQWTQAAQELLSLQTAARRASQSPSAAAADSSTPKPPTQLKSSPKSVSAAPSLVAWATSVAMHPRAHAESAHGQAHTRGASWSAIPTPVVMSVVHAWAQLQD